MCIPRERIENNKYLTRLYTQMEADVAAPPSAFKNSNDPKEMERSYQRALAQRRAVTLPRILEQVTKTISPYRVEVEKVDWWGELDLSLGARWRADEDGSGVPHRTAGQR